MAKTIDFFGETFELNDTVSGFEIWEFAEAALDAEAETDENVANRKWMAANFRILKSIIRTADWTRFRQIAVRNKATGDDLVPIFRAFNGEAEGTENPTGEPDGSSNGRHATDPKSGVSLEDKVSEIYPGRPDLQIAVLRTAGVA